MIGERSELPSTSRSASLTAATPVRPHRGGCPLKWLLILAALVFPSVADADFMQNLTSPGPLAEPHKEFDSKCEKCHVPFKGIPNASCLACHTGTQQRIQSGHGTHFEYEKQGKKCSSCHGDHKGRKHALSPPVESGFKHEITGFVLDGKHASVACNKCHKPGALGPKWTGLAQTCAGCHADFHKGTLGPKCEACHTAVAWKPALKTIAQHKVDMTGGHAGLTCA
jgi:hypothetical protein